MAKKTKIKTSRLVLNDASAVQGMQLNEIRSELANSAIRTDKLDGKDMIVFPAVLMREGVANNIFYPAEELAKFPASWDGRAIPIRHPRKDNGKTVGANNPLTVEEQVVGQLFNCHFDKNSKTLKGECWIDAEKVDKVDPAVMPILEGDQIMNASTGLFLEEEQKSGVFEGASYASIARNLVPDHYALLPDEMGAFPGAGIPRLNQQEGNGIMHLVKKLLGLVKTPESTTDNELTHDQISMRLRDAIQDEISENDFAWIEDVLSESFIYHVDGSDGEHTLFRRSYSIDDDDNLTIGDDREEVEKVISFKTVESTTDNNSQPKPKTGESAMTNPKVDALIANKHTSFAENDKEWLEGLSEELLDKLAPVNVNAEAGDDGGDAGGDGGSAGAGDGTEGGEKPNDGGDGTEGGDGEGPATNMLTVTAEQLDALVDKRIENKLTAKQTGPIVEALVLNEKCPIERDALEKMDLTTLEQMQLVFTPGDYSLQAGPINNRQGDPKLKGAPPMREMKWGEKKTG